MFGGQGIGTRRAYAMASVMAAFAGTAFAFVPAASAVTPPPTPSPTPSPTVQSVSLQSSQTNVTSSTSKQLLVAVNATQGQIASVTLSNGTSAKSESHVWTFQIDSSALTVDSTGRGTLNVPSSALSPFGTMNLTIKPIGNAATQDCHGTPTSKTQPVSLGGTFFFNSLSKGSHAWGTVGKSAGKFTFTATNTVVWTYLNTTNPGACFSLGNLPCLPHLYWQAPTQAVMLIGNSQGSTGAIFVSRAKSLTTPTGASREDEAFATSKKLALVRNGKAASLTIKAKKHASGSAKLSAKRHTKPSSQHCKLGSKTVTETSTVWGKATYKNGTKPLKVREQIFGAIKVANNHQSEISKTKIS